MPPCALQQPHSLTIHYGVRPNVRHLVLEGVEFAWSDGVWNGSGVSNFWHIFTCLDIFVSWNIFLLSYQERMRVFN